ncbi:hypothetical protein [Luteimonas panaciterrae]|uniref:hypothetical protein n=1 Tax=Luteimonas panaciterrae TaxID=363885 RepID=UPI001CF98501|nr:hypothetical protein [Luteimonas panaciterrae]
MSRTKKVVALSTFAGGILVSLACWAYPMPGPGQETIVTYYSDAARTNVIGVRNVAKGSQCQIYHLTWGAQSAPYSTVEVLDCPNTNGEPPVE